MDNAESLSYAGSFQAGHPSITTSIKQAGLPQSFEHFLRESRKINAGDLAHQVTIGKSRDGMSANTNFLPSGSASSVATGLLAKLLRRI